MKRLHMTWILGGMTMAAVIAACSNDVQIVAESAGTTATVTTTGSAGGAAGGTGGSGGASTSSSGGATNLATADTDMAQYQSITVTGNAMGSAVKVLEGPFFVTDVFALAPSAPTITTVPGTDCSVPQDKHTFVLQLLSGPGSGYLANAQIHGIRLPVIKGQSLCALTGLPTGMPMTVLGFKPY